MVSRKRHLEVVGATKESQRRIGFQGTGPSTHAFKLYEAIKEYTVAPFDNKQLFMQVIFEKQLYVPK